MYETSSELQRGFVYYKTAPRLLSCDQAIVCCFLWESKSGSRGPFRKEMPQCASSLSQSWQINVESPCLLWRIAVMFLLTEKWRNTVTFLLTQKRRIVVIFLLSQLWRITVKFLVSYSAVKKQWNEPWRTAVMFLFTLSVVKSRSSVPLHSVSCVKEQLCTVPPHSISSEERPKWCFIFILRDEESIPYSF